MVIVIVVALFLSLQIVGVVDQNDSGEIRVGNHRGKGATEPSGSLSDLGDREPRGFTFGNPEGFRIPPTAFQLGEISFAGDTGTTTSDSGVIKEIVVSRSARGELRG